MWGRKYNMERQVYTIRTVSESGKVVYLSTDLFHYSVVNSMQKFGMQHRIIIIKPPTNHVPPIHR